MLGGGGDRRERIVTGRIERREHHRFLALLETRVLSKEGLPADLKLATLDVAVGGALCNSSHILPTGKQIRISLTMTGGSLPKPLTLELGALVLRCAETSDPNPDRRYEVALKFVRVDPQDRKKMQSYLNSL